MRYERPIRVFGPVEVQCRIEALACSVLTLRSSLIVHRLSVASLLTRTNASREFDSPSRFVNRLQLDELPARRCSEVRHPRCSMRIGAAQGRAGKPDPSNSGNRMGVKASFRFRDQKEKEGESNVAHQSSKRSSRPRLIEKARNVSAPY